MEAKASAKASAKRSLTDTTSGAGAARTIATNTAENVARASSASAQAGEIRHRPTCFRITAVPSNWGKPELEERLSNLDPGLDLSNVELSLFPSCCSIKTQTALLRLDQNTEYFASGWKERSEKQSTFKERGRSVRVNIDKHFYGLTPLNKPEAPIIAEFVPITRF
jgi:hypothetical protein